MWICNAGEYRSAWERRNKKEKVPPSSSWSAALFCWFVLGSIGVYGNDSILVNREWTERRTIYVKESEIDSIGEDTVIENNGIACGNDGCIKIEFLKPLNIGEDLEKENNKLMEIIKEKLIQGGK